MRARRQSGDTFGTINHWGAVSFLCSNGQYLMDFSSTKMCQLHFSRVYKISRLRIFIIGIYWGVCRRNFLAVSLAANLPPNLLSHSHLGFLDVLLDNRRSVDVDKG